MEEDGSFDRKRSLASDGVSRSSMLESLHNVERRVEQPQKKIKRASEDLHNGAKAKMSYAHRGNGIIGEYMRPDSESAENKPSTIPRPVDLTLGKYRNLLQPAERVMGWISFEAPMHWALPHISHMPSA